MKLIAIETGKRQNGSVVFTALREAAKNDRAVLDDVALVYRDGKGTHVDHTKGGPSRWFGRGIDDRRVEQILASREAESLVFALGEEDQVDAVARRVQTIAEGDMRTFDVNGTTLHETTARDATYSLEDTEGALLEEAPIAETLGSDNVDERMNRW